MSRRIGHHNKSAGGAIFLPVFAPDNECLKHVSRQGLLITDIGGVVRYADDFAATLLDRSVTALVGDSVLAVFPELLIKPNSAGYNVAFIGFHFPRGHWCQIQATGSDGDKIRLGIAIDFLFDDGVPPIFLIHIVPLESFPEAAGGDFERLRQALNESDEMAFVTDADGVIQFANERFEAMGGFSHGSLQNISLRELGVNLDHDDFFGGRQTSPVSITFAISKHDGQSWQQEASVRPFVERNKGITHYVFKCRDSDCCNMSIADLEDLANHDYLTGLPNRRLFFDRLRQAVARAAREKGHFALLYLDLDRFKEINDREGHAKGDATLKMLGQRFASCVREVDTMARFGGDEFVCILSDVSRPKDVWTVCEKILATLEVPTPQEKIGEHCPCTFGVSIGIAIYPDDGTDEASLLHRADQAMYSAKRDGGNRWSPSVMAWPSLEPVARDFVASAE